MKRVIRIVGFSEKEETYMDVIAAIHRQFQPDKIEIVFVASEQNPEQPDKGRSQAAFIKRLHDSIHELAVTYPAYSPCEHIPITIENIRRDEINSILCGVVAVDVTAAPKDIAINVISNALRHGGPSIYYVKWLTKFEKGKRNRIGEDSYSYEDLTKIDEARQLSQAYRSQSTILLSLIILVAIFAILAGLSHWYKQLSIFNEILATISVVAGFIGLFTAFLQTSHRRDVIRRSK